MPTKEFKVGEVFQCGLIKLKVEKSGRKCDGCYFLGGCKRGITGACSAESREDKTDVIFVKVDDIEN